MATDIPIIHVQSFIRYDFRNPGNLVEALTAAGADESKYDGNRRIAQLGDSLIKTVILDNAFTAGATREMAQNRLRSADSKKNRENIAKEMGIENFVRLSPRQGDKRAPPIVMSRAISAIVGAVWRDSESDFGVVSKVIENMGIAPREQPCVVPGTILMDESDPPLVNTAGLTENLDTECDVTTMNAPVNAHIGGDEVVPASQEKTVSADISEPVQQRAKKRKMPYEQASSRAFKQNEALMPDGEAMLEELFYKERMKFERLPVPFWTQPFDDLLTHTSISDLGTDRSRMILKVLFYGIASCESLLHLQGILLSCRENAENHLPAPCESLSVTTRFQVIEQLDGNISYLSLLKRCHVLNLITTEGGISPHQLNSGYIVQTQESFPRKSTSGPGNPHHIADAMITKSIVSRTYPHVPCGTAEYERTYRHVSDLRRLGKYLQLLTDRFGLGILGLLPPATFNSALGNSLHVNDSMLLKLPMNTFCGLVKFLEQYQGNVIRQFSSALTPVVNSISHGMFPLYRPLPIEQAEPRQIFEEHKGSLKLLKLLCHSSELQEKV